MDPLILSDVGLWLGATPLAGISNQIVLDFGADELDATTLDESANGFALAGKTVRLEASGFFDGDVDAEIDEYRELEQEVADGQLLTVAPDGVEVGCPALSFEAAIATVGRSGSWGEVFTYELSASAAKNGRLLRGVIAHKGSQAGPATLNGAVQDLGPVPAGRFLFAAVHILNAAGTAPRLKVRIESAGTIGFGAPVERLALPIANESGWDIATAAPAGADRYWRAVVQVEGSDAAFDFLVVVGFADAAMQGPHPLPVYDFQPAAGKWGGFTLSRPGTAARVDLDGDGDLDAVTGEQPRIITGGSQAGAILIEGVRTNYVHNNSFAGAVPGSSTPSSAMGAGWNASATGTGGLVWTVMGAGTDAATGLPYVQIRLNGTFGNAAGFIVFTSAAGSLAIAAAESEVWSESLYCAVVAGSIPAGAKIHNYLRAIGGLNQLDSSQARASADITAQLDGTMRRFTQEAYTMPATTTEIRPTIAVTPAAGGQNIDVTLRIAGVMMEKQAFAAPGVILTSAGAVTTAAEFVSRAAPDGLGEAGTYAIEFFYPVDAPANSRIIGANTFFAPLTYHGNGRLAVYDGTSSAGLGVDYRGIIVRAAVTWDAGSIRLAANGQLLLDRARNALYPPTGVTQERIGSGGGLASYAMPYRLRRFAESVSTARLLALSAI